MPEILYMNPPDAYDSWVDFFKLAPRDTIIRFRNEVNYWTARGEGDWVHTHGLVRNHMHLQNYTYSGVYVQFPPGYKEAKTPGQLTIAQLVALEEFINKQLEEAYERGLKDGRAENFEGAYVQGLNFGLEQGYLDAKGNFEEYGFFVK